MTFKTQSHGKWILAGEHSVLRGSPALSFPVFSYTMKLRYISGVETGVETYGENSELLKEFTQALLKRSLELLKKDSLNGHLILENSIPIGTGLGASAALAVNLAKFFHHLGWLKEEKLFDFARDLEAIAHGKSSGLDIATILKSSGLLFYQKQKKNQPWDVVNPQWKPHLYLSYSGEPGMTADCVKKVEKIIKSDKAQGKKFDEVMQESVLQCKEALQTDFSKNSFQKLQEGIDKANSCFEFWKLYTPMMEKTSSDLRANGAASVKPVGSGGGGYLLSLWHEAPSQEINERLKLTPCF